MLHGRTSIFSSPRDWQVATLELPSELFCLPLDVVPFAFQLLPKRGTWFLGAVVDDPRDHFLGAFDINHAGSRFAAFRKSCRRVDHLWLELIVNRQEIGVSTAGLAF